MDEQTNQPLIYLCKYHVANLIFMKDDERIDMDATNILTIEYLNDYENNLRAILKVVLRIDIRRKLWILKNKKDVKVKFELLKGGVDSNIEGYVTTAETVWNLEFRPYFNDEDDAIDTHALEERIKANESGESSINEIEDENYFESQNLLDVYLFHQGLLDASTFSYNNVFTEDTLQQIMGRILTESKHPSVLAAKVENDEVYKELLIPGMPAYQALLYLDQYYGLYETGSMIYYDIDTLYILNLKGKCVAKREDEWPETTFLVARVDSGTPGNGMVRREGEKVFYISITEMNFNPSGFGVSDNASLGSDTKVVVTDDTAIDITQAEQPYISRRNENILMIRKDENKFIKEIIRARLEELNDVLYISGENFDINAFTPNKEFTIVFDETLKHERYGKRRYRLAYAYHILKVQGDEYMTSSHKIILKRCAEESD